MSVFSNLPVEDDDNDNSAEVADNFFDDIKFLCKVCLQPHNSIYHLNGFLRKEGPRVWTAIEYVTSKKVDTTTFPTGLCKSCFRSLNVAYDFKKKYEHSADILQSMLEPKLDERDPDDFYTVERYVEDVDSVQEEDSTQEGVTEILIIRNDSEDALGGDVSLQEAEGSEFDPATETIKIEIEEDNTESFDVQYKCNGCHKLYFSRRQFLKHRPSCLNPMQQDVITATMIKKLVSQCPICFKKLISQRQVNHHIQNVHNKGTKQYQCESCDYIGISKAKLSYHKMKEHEEKKYFCDMCPKSFFRQAFLDRHKEFHTKDVVRTVCPICGKKFHHTSLFYHMKMHNRIHNYKCNYCEKSYYSLSCLKRHEVTHTKIRSYSCTVCAKMFYSGSELKKHTYIHGDKKPYKCKFCNKGFTSSYNYKVHLLNYTGDSECPFCYKTFIDDNILNFHKNRSHKNKTEKDDEEEEN